mmetsp:Transcript_5269/g.12306  ORF Transcript_5269/g.12306 Transcript_5269/m.12306 type:complete len:213 (+) Transcript_5269:437-1075(+)
MPRHCGGVLQPLQRVQYRRVQAELLAWQRWNVRPVRRMQRRRISGALSGRKRGVLHRMWRVQLGRVPRRMWRSQCGDLRYVQLRRREFCGDVRWQDGSGLQGVRPRYVQAGVWPGSMYALCNVFWFRGQGGVCWCQPRRVWASSSVVFHRNALAFRARLLVEGGRLPGQCGPCRPGVCSTGADRAGGGEAQVCQWATSAGPDHGRRHRGDNQ